MGITKATGAQLMRLKDDIKLQKIKSNRRQNFVIFAKITKIKCLKKLNKESFMC